MIGRLERLLVGEVLVERRRADPETVGDAAHRERIESLLVQDRARRRHDLAGRAGSARQERWKPSRVRIP